MCQEAPLLVNPGHLIEKLVLVVIVGVFAPQRRHRARGLAPPVRLLDLREHPQSPSDYSLASPIEPSETGGDKIERAVARAAGVAA